MNDANWCVAPVVTQSCTGTPKNWSDPTTWPSGKVPENGNDVTIPSGTIVVFDVAESAKLNLLKVEGCLEWRLDNSIDQTLHAHQIFVFGGKFSIGSSTVAYTKKAKIVLYGSYNDSFTTMPGTTEAGNKMIVNVGTVKMIGKARSRMSRLRAEAQKGALSLSVEAGLDWVAGDQIGLAPTATQWQHYEKATIASYNGITGALTLTAPLKYYHFGTATTTATNYQGLDMRGEVILLTRNIVI